MNGRPVVGHLVSLGLAALVGGTLGGTGIVGAATAAPATSATGGVVDLLDPTARPAAAADGGSRQSVEVDESVLRTDDAQLDVRLDLAPGVAPTAILRQADAVAGGYQHWTGDLAGVPDSMATIIRRGDAVSGLVSSPEGSYTITTRDSGAQELTKVSATASDADLVLPAPKGIDAQDLKAASDDPNPVVDVLVAYTPQAASAAGGTAAARSLAALSIAVTNDSFAVSGVQPRVQLAGTLPTTATSVGSASVATLVALKTPGDGAYDNVHAVRDTVGADLVSLLVADGGANCGIAYLPASAASGFSVVDQGCAVANLSFPHELGHNLGANHDRHVASDSPLPYAYGTVNVPGRWRTIMAYNDKCAAAGVTCRRLARWSNPEQTYLGAPLGVRIGQPDAADNRSALNTMANLVADYRQSAAAQSAAPSAPLNVSASDGWNSTVRWSAPDTGATSVVSYTITSSPAGWTGTALQSARSVVPTGLDTGTAYTFSVTASNSAGASPESAPTAAVVWREDRTDPTVAMRSPVAPYTLSGLTAAWSTSDAVSGVTTVDVQYARAPYNGAFAAPVFPAAWQRTTVDTVTMSNLLRGYTYCISVRARDVAGNTSAWSAPRCSAAALDDRSLTASSGWTRTTNSVYHAGTATVTTRSGATLSRTNVQAKRIYLVATRCPTCGTVGVYLNGKLVKQVSLRSTTTTRQSMLTIAAYSSVRSGTVSVRSLISGRPVHVDGLVLSRA